MKNRPPSYLKEAVSLRLRLRDTASAILKTDRDPCCGAELSPMFRAIHYGVQAAAEFVCRVDLVSQLFSRLRMRPQDRIPDFEAPIAVKVNGAAPVDSQLVMVRLRRRVSASR